MTLMKRNLIDSLTKPLLGFLRDSLSLLFTYFIIMARVHYGTSRLYDEYAALIDAYIQETYGPDYLKTIKTELDLSDAARKYKLLVEVLNTLSPSVNPMEVVERPTSVEHHGGDYAPVYTIEDGTARVLTA